MRPGIEVPIQRRLAAHSKVRHAGLWFLCLIASAVLLGAPVRAHAQDELDDDLWQLREAPGSREAVLRELRRGGPRQSAKDPEVAFARRQVRAEAFGAGLAARAAQQWLEALPNSWRANWRASRAELGLGHVDAHERLVQTSLRLAPHASDRAHVCADTAEQRLAVLGDVPGALQWIERAEREIATFGEHQRKPHRSRGRQPDPLGSGTRGELGVLRARILAAGTRAKVEAARGRFDEARRAANAQIAMADEALQWASSDLGRKREGTADLTHRARLTLTAVLIESGLVFDAERALEDATRRQASLPTRSEVRLDAADQMVSLRIAQDRFDDAERLARELVKLTGDLPSGQASARHLRARLRWHAALAALGRWEDARAAIAETDRVFAASPSLRAAAEEDALVRGWVLLQQGDARAALDVLEPARTRALETFGPSSPGTALLTGLSAWALWDQGARPEALARFDEAMPRLMASDGLVAGLFERGLRNALRRAIAAAYLRSMAAGNDRARQIGALAVADALMGASVQQALSEAALRTRVDPAVQSLVRQEQDLRHRVEALHQALNRPSEGDGPSMEAELRRTLAAQLRALHDEYLAARDALQQALPRDIRADGSAAAQASAIAAQLGAGEAFVLIWPTDTATYVWFVPAAGVARFHAAAAGAAEIASLVERVRASTVFPAAGPLPPFDIAAATRLRALLLEPLRPALDDVRHLVVAAGGSLGRLPFALLPAEQPPGAAPAAPNANAWLVNQMAVSQWPSARAWQALEPLRRSPQARSPFLGWGDPAFAGEASAPSAVGRSLDLRRSASASIDYHAIPPLPDTRAELVAIAETLRADPQRDLLLGPRATRSSVVAASRSGELAERRVVAFATHGLMAGDLPGLDQPALALAATGEEATDPLAPLLRLDDVLQLRLNADWVVLSACNTAAADGRAEEALSGLARGFFFAGARSLLVTHWAVETESARRLTTGTFAYHAAHPEAGKAESLRRAMLDLMNDPRYRHPAYWAPYALVGDGRH